MKPFIFVPILISPLLLHATMKNADVEKILNFKTGLVTLIPNQKSNCEGDIIDFVYENTADSINLRLGNHSVFPNLEKNESTEKTINGCSQLTSTTLKNHSLTQKIKNICPNKNDSFEKSFFVEQTIKTIKYRYSFTGNTKKEFECEYSF